MRLLPSFGGHTISKDGKTLAQINDTEGLNGCTEKTDETEEKAPKLPWRELSTFGKVKRATSTLLYHFYKFITVFLVMEAFCSPSKILVPNSNPVRHVHLNRTGEGGYGMELSGNRIVKLIPGGAADLFGNLTIDDEILSVNGMDATSRTWAAVDLMNIRDDDAKLTVVEKSPEVPARDRFLVVLKLSILPYLVVVFFTCIYESEQKPAGATRTVTITKSDGRFGFSVHNCTIYNVIPGGPADTHGELKKLEEIVSINGVGTKGMSTETIIELLDTRGDEATLVVRNQA